MLEIAVIADDLTGAADTGIQFRALYGQTLLMADNGLAARPPQPMPEVLTVHTMSRALPVGQARARVRLAAERLTLWRPGRVFKKVDSCLRGNIGAETDALMDTLGLSMSFIAPAFPAVGRTTVDDVHRVHGQPVAESEMGRDPATPVTESRLSKVIAAQSHHPVGHVDLATVAAGGESLVAAVERLAGQGSRHIVFDIAEQDQLSAVAGLALKHFPGALLVGSAGLAQGLCDCHPHRAASSSSVRRAPGHHLIALGTASPRARRQVEVLEAIHSCALIELDAGRLAKTDLVPEEADLADLADALAGGDVVARIAPPPGDTSARTTRRVAGGFGALIAALVARMPPASLFLSGGDTALSVLGRLGARGLRLESEIVPGLVLGTVVGCAFEGLAVGTKPGAFGDDDALLKWREFWS
jgi:uncharacterized protein YgbK (DUF1537 family)